MSKKIILGFYTPDQKLETTEDYFVINNYFLFEYPLSPTVTECFIRKARETWLSGEPIDWHPYNCFPLCTKEGEIIPDRFLPADSYVSPMTTYINYTTPEFSPYRPLQEHTDQATGKVQFYAIHHHVYNFNMLIANALQTSLEILINPPLEYKRNIYLSRREFILQDTLYNRNRYDRQTPTQPYLYSFYRTNLTRDKPQTSDDFKIHLCPKPEYIFWTLFKIIQLSMTMPPNDFRITNVKACVPGRIANVRADDGDLIKHNGGSSPGVIVYILGSKNLINAKVPINSSEYKDAYKKACIKYLLQVAKHFNNVQDAIGNITEPVKLPFGNVRFNKLLCYASGTRSNKLDILDGLVTDPAITGKYNASEWVQELCDAGDIATIERYFIKNICGTPGLNVIQLKDAPLPDPRLIESMVESPATGGAGGAAGGAGIPGRIGTSNTFGGYRKLKSRISKKTDRKKYKRRKTRK